MAEMRSNQDEQGIKLFGKTIMLQNREVKEEAIANKADEETVEKKPEKIIACPRCRSMETKFCYFNNYNVNQPRHFCKGCQRYWTAGGALRNVPIGAGRRKSKPPCRSFGGLPESCVFDSSVPVQQFELHVMAAHGSFRRILPIKRQRDCQGGQTC